MVVLSRSCGYGVAFGNDHYAHDDDASGNGVLGTSQYLTLGVGQYGKAMWLFQWAFAGASREFSPLPVCGAPEPAPSYRLGAAATIVSGAVAERVMFTGYVIYAVVLIGFICEPRNAAPAVASAFLT
jgi:ammonia channel protein AmtB